jgi:hypothetical protein
VSGTEAGPIKENEMTTYLLSVHGSADDEMPAPEVLQEMFAAVERFNTKVQEAGAWVFAGGLHPADTATVVDASKGGDLLVTDGPFVEGKEHIGGFWVIKAADLDEAMRWAAEGSAACQGPVEVRPFQDDV